MSVVEALKTKYHNEFPKKTSGVQPTPLVCACQHGRFDDVKLLITGYNDANGSNGNNNNTTLKEYVNQEGKDSDGCNWTPLMIAARYEHFQIVKYLIEQGEADPNIAHSEYGYNALHVAARNNKKDTQLIELLLTNIPLTSINKKAWAGNTPLDWAYEYNKSPIKQKIIDLIRSKGGKRGEEIDKILAPLMDACEKGRFEDVKVLITGFNDANGSNGNNNNTTLKEYVNQEGKDSDGCNWTPLMIAARYEHFQIVKYLIEQGEADPNITGRNGFNALHVAARNNKKNTELIEFLLTNMPLNSINKKAWGGYTPLDHADINNKNDIKNNIIKVLRSKGAMYSDNYIRIRISEAAKKEDIERLKQYLNEQNADLNALDDHGRTALHWAAWCSKQKLDTLNLLLNHKTFSIKLLSKTNKDGFTALNYADINTSGIKNDIIQLLESKFVDSNSNLKRRKFYHEDDLFTMLPTTTIINNIIPFFCNPLPLRNGVVGTLSVSSKGNGQLGVIDFLHLFGKTKKSFAFIGEDETIEGEPLFSVRSIFHSLMLNRKYNGSLTLLKGCQNGTVSLRDAKILVEVCHTKHLTEKDESGKTALTHAGYKDLREVATYLISIGGDENEFKTGKLHQLLNKYNIGSSSNSRVFDGSFGGRSNFGGNSGGGLFGQRWTSNNSSTTITEQTWQTFELEVAKIYQKPILLMTLKNKTLILEDLAFFIEACHLDISMKDEKGKTAIYYAGYNSQNDEIVSYLLTHGGSEEDFYLGKMEKKYGIPALIKGCQFWNTKVCMTLDDAKVLIETCHVDISEKDEFGNTATYYTGCTNNNNLIDVGKYLLLHGGKEIDFNQGKADWPNAKLLIKKYKKEFPNGTPIVCACQKGRFEDVKLLITGYNDVNGSNGNNNNNMTLKEYMNQEGKDSRGIEYTPLMIAAWEEHFQIVKYLIEQGEADPNIARSDGYNALHFAARNNKKDTELIEFLLTNMPLTSINKKITGMFGGGDTPLDCAYTYNNSPIKYEIIDLIRSKGGKREEEL